MGGMFALIKVREDLAANDYRDPGYYAHPAGTVAHEVGNDGPDAPKKGGAAEAMPPGTRSAGGGHGHHH